MKSFKKTASDKKLNCVHASIHGKAEHFDISEAIATNDEIKSNIELAGRLTNHYAALHTNTLHKNAINNYTRISMDINDHEWQKYKKEPYNHMPEDTDKFERQSRVLDKTLRSYKSPENLTVWSSSIHNPEKLKNSEGIVHHPAFLSTSTYRPVALNRDINSKEEKNGDYHHHILKINVPKGSPGAYVDHISKYPGEYEYILPKGMNLKHNKTTTTSEKFHHYVLDAPRMKHTHIHEMSLVQE